MTYRILWTSEGVDGGWYKDVDAPDAAIAAWDQAVAAAFAEVRKNGQDAGAPRLISVTDLG
jgi:hypothetical protein